MPSQVMVQREGPPANVTHICSYAGMDAHVFVDITAMGKILSTRCAMVRFVARVQAFVVSQTENKITQSSQK
jgi:hypothetical protein